MSFSASESFLAGYHSLTTGCGTVCLDNWSTVSISGNDRVSFLHNMCTNDIRRLETGSGCETFFTDVKGKVVAHGYLLACENEILLLSVPEQASIIITHLDRYIIREDVQLRDDSETKSWLLVSGAESPKKLETLTGYDTTQLDTPWGNTRCQLQTAEILLVQFEAIWPKGFLLQYSKSEKDQFQNLADLACGTEAWNALRVESVLPLLSLDFDSTNLPQEVNRNEAAISFNKGCYLGQETIARIDALGHVNQQITCLRFDESKVPALGTKLFNAEKEVGVVTTSCWSPRLESPLALALVRRGSNTAGSLLQSDFGQVTVIAPSEFMEG